MVKRTQGVEFERGTIKTIWSRRRKM